MADIPLYVFFIAISLLISLVYYQKNKNLIYLRVFPPFLLLSLLVEIYAIYLWLAGSNTTIIYNFFSWFEFLFYSFVLYHIINSSIAKKVILITAITFAAVDLMNILFGQGIDAFHTATYALGCLIIIGPAIFYFYELFHSPKLISLTKEPSFWVVSGLLFFYCCSFPYYALSDYIAGAAPFITRNFDKIISILNILLYSLFSIAFICRRIAKRSTQ